MNVVVLGWLGLIVFAGSLWLTGGAVRSLLQDETRPLSRHPAEIFAQDILLGSIFIIGGMVFLSLVGLYRIGVLWGWTIMGWAALAHPASRGHAVSLLSRSTRLSWAGCAAIGIMALFILRNQFFLVDVDSHSTYLYAQRLWLDHHGSLFGDPTIDIRVFVPMFNAVPYALGIGLFYPDTFFPQLIVVFWTVVAACFVYGYLARRTHKVAGLAGLGMVLWDQHMFFSGANWCCIINSALISFIAASVAAFWDHMEEKDPFDAVLAMMFAWHWIANKYQLIVSLIVWSMLMIVLMPRPKAVLMWLWMKKRRLAVVTASGLLVSLWFIKNWIVTGCPSFPVLAGAFHSFGWTPEKQKAFLSGNGVLTIPLILKYLGFYYIWPGILAAKILFVLTVGWPLTTLFNEIGNRLDRRRFMEASYWISAALILTIGIVVTNFIDPRVYRYNIGVLAMAAVIVFLRSAKIWLGIPSGCAAWMLALAAFSQAGIMGAHGGGFQRPSVRDNLDVLRGRLTFDDIVDRYWPSTKAVEEAVKRDPVRFAESAWDTGANGIGYEKVSAYLVPRRPLVDVWHSGVVRYESYRSRDTQAIVKDLHRFGIRSLMRVENGTLVFESPEEYARRALTFDIPPSRLFYDYGFPPEIGRVRVR